MKYTIQQDTIFKWANIQETIEHDISNEDLFETMKENNLTKDEAIIELANAKGTTINEKILSLEGQKEYSNRKVL